MFSKHLRGPILRKNLRARSRLKPGIWGGQRRHQAQPSEAELDSSGCRKPAHVRMRIYRYNVLHVPARFDHIIAMIVIIITGSPNPGMNFMMLIKFGVLMLTSSGG